MPFHHRTSDLLAAARVGLALFLALQQHPDVMRFVAEDRPLQTSAKRLIRALPRGRQAARTGYAWWCVMPPARRRWASRVIFIGKTIAPKSVFFSHRPLRGKVTDLNHCRRFAIRV
jgi:hypothetical protein